MAALDLKIDFSLDENVMPGTAEFDLAGRLRFWDDSARPWLLERGYTLFKHRYSDGIDHAKSTPVVPLTGVGGDFPYSFYDDASTFTDANAHDTSTMGRVVFAHDRQHRHVALKLVRRDSEEARILHFLLQEQDAHQDRYIPGLLPILDMLPFGGHWLAVMPRWGETVNGPRFNSVREILDVIKDLLAGLASLHSFRIVHRDIAERNMLVNHFPITYEDISDNNTPVRQRIRKDGRAKYVIYDFNHAAMLPPTTDVRTYQLLRYASWVGEPGVPDVSQGEYSYNPFAYDVWTLGDEIGSLFQSTIPHAPLLAPLVAGMTTWDAAVRFTAQQAQEFFLEQCTTLTAAQLAAVPPGPSYRFDHDIWSGLTPAYVARWCHLRTQPPVWRRLLRWVCRYRAGGAVVRAVRRLLRL